MSTRTIPPPRACSRSAASHSKAGCASSVDERWRRCSIRCSTRVAARTNRCPLASSNAEQNFIVALSFLQMIETLPGACACAGKLNVKSSRPKSNHTDPRRHRVCADLDRDRDQLLPRRRDPIRACAFRARAARVCGLVLRPARSGTENRTACQRSPKLSPMWMNTCASRNAAIGRMRSTVCRSRTPVACEDRRGGRCFDANIRAAAD